METTTEHSRQQTTQAMTLVDRHEWGLSSDSSLASVPVQRCCGSTNAPLKQQQQHTCCLATALLQRLMQSQCCQLLRAEGRLGAGAGCLLLAAAAHYQQQQVCLQTTGKGVGR
jgi:hypothetical protein